MCVTSVVDTIVLYNGYQLIREGDMLYLVSQGQVMAEGSAGAFSRLAQHIASTVVANPDEPLEMQHVLILWGARVITDSQLIDNYGVGDLVISGVLIDNAYHDLHVRRA